MSCPITGLCFSTIDVYKRQEQLIRDLREEWGIVDEEPDEGDEDVENSDDAVVMRVGGMMLIVTLFHGHIPDNEAEINAENNYMWPEAIEVAKAHKAHIMVAVLGEKEKLLERGKLFTKAMAVCCKQKYATGVYTSGVVFEPRFYEGLADMLKEDELPIFNWVWFGLYRSERGLNGYTYGMDVFGKEEMEVLNADAEPEDLRDFLASLASYVLACDVTLKDGETIGFDADDKPVSYTHLDVYKRQHLRRTWNLPRFPSLFAPLQAGSAGER